MNLDSRKQILVIAGAVVFGCVGWKIVQFIRNKAHKAAIDADNRKKYFLHLMRLGEQCLVAEKYDEAVNHLADAMMNCDKPEMLDDILMKSIPEPIYLKFKTAVRAKTELRNT